MPIRKLRDAPWLRVRLKTTAEYARTAEAIRGAELHTVCQEAACPNRSECWSRGTATFLIMGDVCTRNCAFCNVKTGRPAALDPGEPARVAEAARRMELRYAVITSVDRDDLADGGAEHFGQTVDALRRALPGIGVEILTPDFRGCQERASEILAPRAPFIWGHNLETVPRLYQALRSAADYQRSLELLGRISNIADGVEAKSSLMLGLGETRAELLTTLEDLLGVGCRRLTLGQYLRPTPQHAPVEEFHPPAVFEELERQARELGFTHVRSGPLVRSSYLADASQPVAF